MLQKPKCPVIAIEEHYYDQELVKHFGRIEPNPAVVDRMFEFGERRLKEMDEAGIDIQVLSHGAPSAQRLTGDGAIPLTQRVNDRLAAVVAARPDRFAAFAALPTCDPAGAADELERTVKLGFKGAMIHGLANDMFLDDKRFWPIFERAHRLDVPIYLHPSIPHQAVMDVYYKDYVKDFPLVIRAAWGFTVETATQAIRMVLERHLRSLSGAQDHHRASGRDAAVPGLAHRRRAVAARAEVDQLPRRVLRQFPHHHQRQLLRPGADVLRAGDGRRSHSCSRSTGRSSPMPPATQWMQSVPLCDEDKVKILSGNAKRLLRM